MSRDHRSRNHQLSHFPSTISEVRCQSIYPTPMTRIYERTKHAKSLSLDFSSLPSVVQTGALTLLLNKSFSFIHFIVSKFCVPLVVCLLDYWFSSTNHASGDTWECPPCDVITETKINSRNITMTMSFEKQSPWRNKLKWRCCCQPRV